MIEYNIKINMQGERELCEDILFTSGDKKGYRLNLAFYSNGKLYDTSGCALTVKSKRADGAVIIDSGVCTAEGVYYDVADNAIAIEGELEIEVALVRANGVYVTTAVVLTRVRKGFGETGLLSSDNEPVLAKLEAQSLVTQAKANSVANDLTKHNTDGEAHSELFKKEREMYANALKGEMSDSFIYIDDVSPTEHIIKAKISSKNIIPGPYYYDNDYTANGITFTVNNDGSITLNGTPTATAVYQLYSNRATQKLLEKGKKYTLSLQNSPDYYNVFVSNNTSTNGTTWDSTVGANTEGRVSRTFTVHEDYKGIQLYIVVAKNAGTLENVTVYPRLEEGTILTDYTPYVPDIEGVVLKVRDESGREVEEYVSAVDGNIEVTSISPTMTLTTDKQGVNIECEYYLDGQAVIDELTDAIISLGGTI